MNNSLLVRFMIVLGIYFGLVYFGGEIGRKIMYPVTLLVTFLHELGHALGALFTGGNVLAVQINPDGSGYTKTQGGSLGIILMGGYLGSAILGNLLFYIGARGRKVAKITMYVLAAFMVLVGFIWFNSLYTTGFLLAFAAALYFIAKQTDFDREVLMFLGVATIIYIIQDFNVGPRSDLEKYAELLVFIPAQVWMYIWLVISLVLTAINLRMIFKLGTQQNSAPSDYN